jgi:hypothetical protein
MGKYSGARGRYRYQELYDLVDSGKVIETYDQANNAYTYQWAS